MGDCRVSGVAERSASTTWGEDGKYGRDAGEEYGLRRVPRCMVYTSRIGLSGTEKRKALSRHRDRRWSRNGQDNANFHHKSDDTTLASCSEYSVY